MYKSQEMLKVLQESGIDEFNKQYVLTEGDNGKTYSINFYGKKFTVKASSGPYEGKTLTASEEERVNSFIKSKYLQSITVMNDIYNNSKNYISEINNIWKDSDNKSITNARDLINTLNPYSLHVTSNGIYLRGETWWEPEHGWSIFYPKDKPNDAGKTKIQDYTDGI